MSAEFYAGSPGLLTVDILQGVFDSIVGIESIRVTQFVIRMSACHECMSFANNALCHRMDDVDSDDKSKGMGWVLGYLMWNATIMTAEVWVPLDVLLQDM
jgi:hypothetical protein